MNILNTDNNENKNDNRNENKNKNTRPLRNVLISVYDKTGLDKLSEYLINNNNIIYSTGGTLKYIKNLQLKNVNSNNLIDISSYTESPEICNGRVKTLHPKIFGGILALRDNESHINDLNKINCVTFDAIIVNLYPFAETVKNTEEESDIIEQIDIGGHSLIRAGIKNYKNISVLTSPNQYDDYMSLLSGLNDNLTDDINDNLNNRLIESNHSYAKQAIRTIMNYDIDINNWFNGTNTIGISYDKSNDMKYGLNPYMKPSSVYMKNGRLPPYEILNGKPGFINLLDANNAIKLVLESKEALGTDCCTSFKHTSPAGVSILLKSSTLTKRDIDSNVDSNIDTNIDSNSNSNINTDSSTDSSNKTFSSNQEELFYNTRNIDPLSSFGDLIGFSGTVDLNMAIRLSKYVSDGIIAYDYDEDALEVLKEEERQLSNYETAKYCG